MKQKPARRPASSERIIRDIKRKTRKQYSAQLLAIIGVSVKIMSIYSDPLYRLNRFDPFLLVGLGAWRFGFGQTTKNPARGGVFCKACGRALSRIAASHPS